jgi:hypothetical protein
MHGLRTPIDTSRHYGSQYTNENNSIFQPIFWVRWDELRDESFESSVLIMREAKHTVYNYWLRDERIACLNQLG